MERENECLCCREMAEVNVKLQNADKRCITDLPEFSSVCLDLTVLETTLLGMVEMGYQPVPQNSIGMCLLLNFLHTFVDLLD